MSFGIPASHVMIVQILLEAGGRARETLLVSDYFKRDYNWILSELVVRLVTREGTTTSPWNN